MKAYLAIKYKEDGSNRKLIEDISSALEENEIENICMFRDCEKWGDVKLDAEELMELTFENLDDVDLFIVEFSEKGVGLGIEAGYAYANNIPIIVIAKEGSDISSTLKGIAKEIVFYNSADELGQKFKALNL